MADQTLFSSYTWEVAPKGYRWIETKHLLEHSTSEVRWLTDGRPLNARWQNRLYDPMEIPSLFRTFADTPLTEESVLPFANRYGLLREGTSPILMPDGKTIAFGETLDQWVTEIRHMRLAIEIWDALRANDAHTLKQRLEVDVSDRKIRLTGKFSDGYIDSYGDQYPEHEVDWDMPQDPEVATFLTESVLGAPHGNLARAALFFLQEYTHQHMNGHITTRLLYTTGRDRLNLHVIPNNLLGALWLQFARSIDGDKEYRRCEACGTWFEVSLDANRKSAKYCRSACRSKAYRDRKAQAAE